MITPHQPQPVEPTIDIEQVGAARKIADEIAQIQEQAAQKHIETEQKTNDFLLDMGQESVSQWLAQASK